MDEKKIAQFNRHDFVIISKPGRERIFAELRTKYNAETSRILADVFSSKYCENGIPGIVRRAKVIKKILLPVGFVPVERLAGRRLHIGAFANFNEITHTITPYELLQMPFKGRNNCLQVASEIAKLARSLNQVIGILGSAGLEIITGCNYTNEASDLDLVIKTCDYEKITEIYRQVKKISSEHGVPLDMEVALDNGYGVKAAELFMNTKTLLGKSLDDVTLLDRKTVLKTLTKKESYYNGN